MWGFESSIPSHLARSSSGPGHRPLKAEIAGSNPARATTYRGPACSPGLSLSAREAPRIGKLDKMLRLTKLPAGVSVFD